MQTVYCPNCGKPIDPDDHFCIYCGEEKPVIKDAPQSEDSSGSREGPVPAEHTAGSSPALEEPGKAALGGPVSAPGPEEKKPGRKRSGLKLAVLLPALFAIALAAAFLILFFSSPAKKAVDLIMSDKVPQASKLYEEKIKGKPLQQLFFDMLSVRSAKKSVEEYNAGSINCYSASARLGALSRMSPSKADKLQELEALTERLRASKEAFLAAGAASRSGRYENALACLDKVIPEDSNYSRLDEARENAAQEHRDHLLADAQKLLDKRDYAGARAALEAANADWPDDARFRDKLRKLDKGVFQMVDYMMDNRSKWEKDTSQGYREYCVEILMNKADKGFLMHCAYVHESFVSIVLDPHTELRTGGWDYSVSLSNGIERIYTGSGFSYICSSRYDPTASESEKRALLEKLIDKVI